MVSYKTKVGRETLIARVVRLRRSIAMASPSFFHWGQVQLHIGLDKSLPLFIVPAMQEGGPHVAFVALTIKAAE